MANMCNNWVKFRGADLTEIKRLMADAISSNEGWLPEGIDGDRCLFDVCLHEEWYQFITKWSPPIDEMVAICRKAKVSFSMDYDELGFNIYGTAEYDYDTDTLKEIDLDDEHFKRITEDGDGYLLDGEFVESVYDALYTMLEEVKKGKEVSNTSRKMIDHVIDLLENFEGDGVVTDDLLYYMRSNLEKGGVL